MSDSHGDPAAHSRIMKSFDRLFRLTEACKTDNRRKRDKLREWRHMKKDIKKNVNDIPARYQQVQLQLARVMVDRLKQQVKHLDSAVEKRRIPLNTNKAIRELKVETEVKTAHDGNFITIKYTFNHPELPPDHLFGVVKPLIMKAVQEAFSKMNRSQQLIFQLRADGLYVAAPAPPVERGNWTKKRHIRSLVGLEEHMNQIKSEIIPPRPRPSAAVGQLKTEKRHQHCISRETSETRHTSTFAFFIQLLLQLLLTQLLLDTLTLLTLLG